MVFSTSLAYGRVCSRKYFRRARKGTSARLSVTGMLKGENVLAPQDCVVLPFTFNMIFENCAGGMSARSTFG